MTKQNNIVIALIITSFHTSNAQEWTRLSEVTGLAQSLCTHQGTTLIMGQPGGPYRSVDNGTTWIDTESNNQGTWSIASDGVNLYAASAGVSRSTDNGVTWSEANVGLPSSPIVYVVAAVGGKAFAGLYGGVYASTNGGSSWTRSDSGITHLVIASLAGQGDTVFAGTSDGKVFRSTNGGLYWADVSPTFLYSSSTNVNAIFISDGSVFLGDTGPGFSPGILRSDDWGMTWTQFSTGIGDNPWGLIAGFARVDTFLFAGLYNTSFNHGGVYRGSLNTDWTNVSAAQMIALGPPDYPDTHYTHAWSLAAMGTTVFAGMSAGLYRSTDLGTTWQQITSDVSNGNDNRIAFTFRDDTLYTGGSSSGVFISTDNGAFWEEHVTNLSFHITSYAFVDTVMFAGTGSAGASRSMDGGRVWESVASGLSGWVNKLASSGTTLLAATETGMYVSSDLGDSWLNTSWSALGAVSLHASGSVVLASDPYEVYRSTDVGQTWVQITNGLPASWYVRDYARIGSNLFMGGGPAPNMYMSIDEGLSWSGISGPFASVVWALASAGDTLYAATEYFVYYTTDLGQNWQLIPNDGLTGITGFRALMVKGGYLYAGMDGLGYGAIRRSVPGSTSVEQIEDGIPERMTLLQNYPNPFNPKTAISFQLSAVSFVNLRVFDLLGREVALLVNEEKTPGTYTVPWNAWGMASGVYVYRIIAGEFVQSQKMILAK